MSEPVYLPDEKCPVCGMRTVFAIDQMMGDATSMPVTMCAHCDNQQAFRDMGLSERRIRWIHIKSLVGAWWDAWVNVGLVGVVLTLAIILCFGAMAALPAGDLRIAFGVIGTVATFANFWIYIQPLGFRRLQD